jgi:hypothetical protein
VRAPLLLGLVLVLVGCGSSSPPPSSPPKLANFQKDTTPSRPANTLYRDEVKAAVAEGMARFLTLVEVEALTDVDEVGDKRFIGFTVLTLRPAGPWLLFDIVPGDVVTRVNGVSVSHYDYLLPVFDALGSANELRVEMLRGGKPRTLVIPIVERGGSASTKASTDGEAKVPLSSDAPKAEEPKKEALKVDESKSAPASAESGVKDAPSSDEPKNASVPAANKKKKKQKSD